MNRDRTYRFRLDADEAERLENEAAEKGMSKADHIRDALGWKKAERGPRPTSRPAPVHIPPPGRNIDIGGDLSGVQELARRLGRKPDPRGGSTG